MNYHHMGASTGTITAKMEFIALDADSQEEIQSESRLLSTGEDYFTSIYILGCNNTRRGWKYVTLDTYDPELNTLDTPVCTHEICP